MTARETERLTRVEENQKSTNEKLDYLIERFDKYVKDEVANDKENAKKFITRFEAKAYAAAISMAMAILAAWLMLRDHLK